MGYQPTVALPEAGGAEAKPVDATGGHVDYSGLTKEEQAVIKAQMKVGGILKQGATCLAIINQQLVREGEDVSLNMGKNLAGGDKSYHFRVKQLTPEKILLESMQE